MTTTTTHQPPFGFTRRDVKAELEAQTALDGIPYNPADALTEVWDGPTVGHVSTYWEPNDGGSRFYGVRLSIDIPEDETGDGIQAGFDLTTEQAARLRDQLTTMLDQLDH